MNVSKPLRIAGSLVLVAAVSTACAGKGAGGGGTFPSKNITIVVPYAAGGPTDLAARAPAECLKKQLGKTVIVENQPGGGGAIGAAKLVNAKPDGHTIGVLSTATVAIAPFESTGAGFKPEDFAHIGQVYEFPSVIQVAANSPYKTAKDLFAAAAQQKGKITFATPGASTPYHIELRRLTKLYGVPVQLVPFDGAAPARAAMLGGNVDAVFDVFNKSDVAQFKAGKVRPLAVGLPQRVDLLKDVPTLRELGYTDLVNARGLFTLGAPAATPKNVVDRLAGALSTCLKEGSVVKALGEEYVADTFVDGEALKKVYADVVDVYRPILTS
jgi:tripartite-type tricarboxylate transporter receptor subunit TctC